MARSARNTGFNGMQLCRARREKRLSQTELAEQLGVHRSTVVRWESGMVEPSPEQIDDIAVALSTPHSWFIEEAAEAIPYDDPLWLMDPELRQVPLEELQQNAAMALQQLGKTAKEIARATFLARPRVEELMVGKPPTAREIQRFRDIYGKDFEPTSPGRTRSVALSLPVGNPIQLSADEKLDIVLQRLARIEQRLMQLEHVASSSLRNENASSQTENV